MTAMTDEVEALAALDAPVHDQLGAQQPGEDDLVTAGHLTAGGG